MKFRVLSHHAATKYSPKQHGHDRAVLIRITSMPEFEPLQHGDEFHDVLHLKFDDITATALRTLPEENALRMTIFDETHACQILEFYRAHHRDCDAIVVHCDAGISRSSAVAISLAEFGEHTDELERMTTGHTYWPNPHVWSTIRHTYGWDTQRQNEFEELFNFLEEVNKHVL